MERTKKSVNIMYVVLRLLTVLACIGLFVSSLNPARISDLVGKTASLFTSAISYSNTKEGFTRALSAGWINQGTITLLYVSSLLTFLGVCAVIAGACMSVGTRKLQRLGLYLNIGGSLVSIVSIVGIYMSYSQLFDSPLVAKLQPIFSYGYYFYWAILAIILILSIIVLVLSPKVEKDEKYGMESKYKLFLLFVPFIALIFVFSYLPLWGWRYAFFDYKSGGTLSLDSFVGFKYFTMLFQNASTRSDIVKVLRNTLAMSFLGIGTSWIAMAFAIFINEIKCKPFRRIIQTLTTIPNFISWVLVYAVAFAMFSTEGFINSIVGGTTNYLMNGSHIWLKMLAWGLWKGTGWSAIIYIAAISGIDQQLYEAATVDGAGRFQRMRHITLPGLVPTYCVLLLLAVAGILSNGMDQYLVFENPRNQDTIQVLDLYVYKLGIQNGRIPLSTLIGMVKSIVSVVLLFGANKISKVVRGESII
ncbi:MAG: ABC transporter permease subunit [bacterium]|nr:ABC transporter permease subunit [bacterium]